MKKFNHHKKKYLIIFSFVLFIIICILPLIGEAADPIADPYQNHQPNLELQVPIFGYTNASNIAEYIGKIYAAALWIILPILIVMMIFAGTLWALSGGDKKLIGTAKDYIKNGVIGFGIVLFSYIFLSLIGITEIRLPDIAIIQGEEIPAMQDLIIINGVEMTVDQAMSMLPPERRGNVSAFNNAPCPKGQTSFPVFFTNYYTPEFGDKGSYMPTFWCNIAMQCSCPNGINKGASCGLKSFPGGYHPCNEFSASTPYCNKTASGKPPKGNYTIAADIPRKGHAGCFKIGCQFKIKGSNDVHEIQDTGSAILGTHMDFYVGTGRGNLNKIAGVYTIELMNPGSCFR